MDYGRKPSDAEASTTPNLPTGSNVVELARHRDEFQTRFPTIDEVVDQITSDERLSSYT